MSPFNSRDRGLVHLNVRSIHALLAELPRMVEVRLVVVKRTEYVARLASWQDAFSCVNVCEIDAYPH